MRVTHQSSKTIRLLWHWGTMGPYHFARMSALGRQPGIELTVVEDCSVGEHGWNRTHSDLPFSLITSHEGRSGDSRLLADRYAAILAGERPEVIVEGLCDMEAVDRVFAHLRTYPDCKLLLWTETTEWDRPRAWWRESLKRTVLAQFDGALTAGSAHAQYLRKLGVPDGRVTVAGGCVDNEYFRTRAEKIRSCVLGRDKIGTAAPYFLFVGRLVPQKNVRRLISAYGRYRAATPNPWDLVIVGSGPLEGELREAALSECRGGVVFAGLKQLEEVVYFYAWAGCFILPSTSEPWGLVANEAIASGIPVALSHRCGCAHELVRDGETGFLFDPWNPCELAELMGRVSSGADDLRSMAAGAAERLSEFTPERYGRAAAELVRALASEPSVRHNASRRALLAVSSSALHVYAARWGAPAAATAGA